ncbi:transglycosylase SLT domain-containing protein [Xanthomonas sp. Kuri4-1]
MLPGIEMMACTDLAVPATVMSHVAHVESSFNPYAIGVVGGRLVRQPKNLGEALSTARMLEEKGYNFSLGISQVNRYNLAKYGLDSYEKAFQVCPNVVAGSQILAECYGRATGDWGKAFSCYYSGNFTTGYRHGYVQKVYASIASQAAAAGAQAIPVVAGSRAATRPSKIILDNVDATLSSLAARRGASAVSSESATAARETSAITQNPLPPVQDEGPVRLTVAPAAGAMPALPPTAAPVQTQAPQAAPSGPVRDSALVF